MKKSNLMKVSLGLAFFVGSVLIAYFAVKNLYSVYPNLPVLKDFLFWYLPSLDLLFLSNIIITLTCLSFIFFVVSKNKFKESIFYTTTISVYYLIRSVLIYLTPLADPYRGQYINNFLVFPSGGMFPSGHTGLMTLLLLFTLKEKPKFWKIYFAILLVLEMATLILSRAHYSIDIVGALFIAYGIWKISDEHFKKKLTLE